MPKIGEQMKVLLVSPKSHTGGLEALRTGNQILQGVLFIAAAARDAGHKAVVVIADATDVDRYIRRYQPDLVGVSCVTATYPVARELLIHIRQKHPDLPTVIGGHHATFMYEDIFRETDVNYICRGEGEEVFVKLLAALEVGNRYPDIPGMVYCQDGVCFNDETIAILDDLAHLPRITLDLVAPEFNFSPKLVSSRGCPFRCSFCSISAFYGGKYRQRTVDEVITDLKDYMSWGFDQFWFHDDNLTVNKAWLTDFCNRLLSERIKIRWNAMSRVSIIAKEPELIALMHRAGCSLLSIGIESGIPEVIERMHKNIDLNDIDKAIAVMDKIGITHNWYMILGSGDEYDTPEYLQKNLDFFKARKLGYLVISILTPLPGTELFDKLKKENRILHYNWEDYDIAHCVYQPLGMEPEELQAFMPKAYKQIYLSKGWRLIPLALKSIKTGAMRPQQILTGGKILLQNKLFGRDFLKAMEKKK